MHQLNTETRQDAIKYLQYFVYGGIILYFGRTLFIPMFYGLLVAIVLYPVCKWLEQRKISKTIAILISLSVVIVLFVALVLLLGWQITMFREDLPSLVEKIKPGIPAVQQWLSEHLYLSFEAQQKFIDGMEANVSTHIGGWAQGFVNGTVSTLFGLFLVPIYSALFLYHRGTFVKFLHRIFSRKYGVKIDLILQQTINTYYRFIIGMIRVYIIVGILNSLGLMALGIKHAFLFGILTAIMTIIPYVGIIVSAALPVSIAFLTKDSIWYPLGVIAVFSFVQYLEANVIFPKVVGAQLNVSTWATLVVIIAGGIIWGVSGMILFIPFVAIFKIISDHIAELGAVNILLKRDT